MARLFTVQRTATEIADWFDAEGAPGLHVPPEMTEGDNGLVLFATGGQRRLRSMGWGFPRLTAGMRLRGEEPVRVGLLSDLTNPISTNAPAGPCETR